MNINLPGQAQGLGEAGAAGTQDPGGVGLVDHQPGAVAFFEGHQVPEGGHVAVHREDAVGDDEHPAGDGVFFE